MVGILARLWIFALMILAAVFCLTGFGLLTLSPVIIGILWGILALSLLVSLLVRSPAP